MFRKVDISKWIDAELHTNELALLRAEDELAAAQLRVDALRSRSERLKARQEAAPQNTDREPSPALAAYDRARTAFNSTFRPAISK